MVACAIVCVFLPAVAQASGFYTPDVGAKTVGRGAAWIVGVDDLTAIYLNPAGLASLRGTNLTVIDNFDWFNAEYKRSPVQPAVFNNNSPDILPFVAMSSDFGLKNLTFAFAGYSPYGVGERYPTAGPQRYEAIEIHRGQYYLSVGAGWAITPWARIGGAVGVGRFWEDDKYAYSPLNDDFPAHDVVAHANFQEFGNFMSAWGVQFGPFSGFEFGGSYQPPNNLKLSGPIVAQIPPMFSIATGGTTYRDKMTISLGFPAIARGGVRQLITDKFDLEFDVVWTEWSRLVSEKIHFDKGGLMSDYAVAMNWRDTWNYRFGGQYEVLDKFFVRAGGWHDDAATPSNYVKAGAIELPRWAANCGVGYTLAGVTIDVAYSHIWMKETTISPADTPPDHNGEIGDPRGVYRGNYDMLVMGVNFNFNQLAAAFKK